MELDEVKSIWLKHENRLVKSTNLNKELLRKLLIAHTEKRIDWIKIRALAGLILPLFLLIFIAIPRIEFALKFDIVLGIILFGSISVITYLWAIRLYLHIERLNFSESVLSVRKQLKLVEKYKLRIKRYCLTLAPLMIIGIFLSAGIPFLSSKMIPFYILMVVVFFISMYVRSKYGLIAQIRKIKSDLEEISKLELDSEKTA